LLGVGLPFEVIATVSTLLRLYTRFHIVRKLGWDDLCISIANVIISASALAVVIQWRSGIGEHVEALSDNQVITQAKLQYWTSAFFYLSTAFLKLSVLLFYRTIFGMSKKFKLICDINIVFIAAYNIAGFLTTIFACTPVAHYWTRRLSGGVEGHCIDIQLQWYLFTSLNMVTDFSTVVLPMPMLGKLQVSKNYRFSLFILFAISFLPCLISIIRFWPNSYLSSPDFTYHSFNIDILAAIESTIGVICINAPNI
ncbi:hypothetical protein K490DRAFT_16649, partial [Saccharata proteae CBS 121410]